jgi:prepilin signal peptidase PulO-like enzyme (type II secretory pathway)
MMIFSFGLGVVAGVVADGLSRRLAQATGSIPRPDLLSAALAVADGLLLAVWANDQTDMLVFATKAAVLMLLSLVLACDIRERAVYPAIVYPAIVCLAVAAPALGVSTLEALEGAAVGGVVFGLLYAIARLRYGPGAFGAGDVSVAVLLGVIVGLPRLPLALLLVGITGAGLALLAAIRARSMRATFAYAPALSLAAMATTLLHM